MRYKIGDLDSTLTTLIRALIQTYCEIMGKTELLGDCLVLPLVRLWQIINCLK